MYQKAKQHREKQSCRNLQTLNVLNNILQHFRYEAIIF